MNTVKLFGEKPDGTCVVSFFKANIEKVANALRSWGGRLSGLTGEKRDDCSLSFDEYIPGGNEHQLRSNGIWTAHFDNSTTISSGLVMKVSEIARCVGVRFTTTTISAIYPCRRIEYFDGQNPTQPIERIVGIQKDGSKWRFTEEGTPLPFEEPLNYLKPRISDRFTSEMAINYALGLGISIEDIGQFAEIMYLHNPTAIKAWVRTV